VEGARPADPVDLAVVATLWGQAVAELAGVRGGDILAADLTIDELDRYLEESLDDRERFLAVGTLDQSLIGMAAAHRRSTGEEVIAVVDLIYVEPGARQVGVGEALLGEVSSWAREVGCTSLDAPALPGSRSAKAFFEGHGFQARLLTMHHRLHEAV
jgi:GNAT superfamily N-acetyltransferase